MLSLAAVHSRYSYIFVIIIVVILISVCMIEGLRCATFLWCSLTISPGLIADSLRSNPTLRREEYSDYP